MAQDKSTESPKKEQGRVTLTPAGKPKTLAEAQSILRDLSNDRAIWLRGVTL